MQLLFHNLLIKKSLEILKLNKHNQKRINLNINDYKAYSEKYSSIVIEIIPVKKKYGNFININEIDKLYYHIYFNNNKEEIKRTNLNENENIDKIVIIINYRVESFKCLFSFCNCIESIYFKKFSRNNIENMTCMFSGCSSLKEINFSNFNSKNVTNMMCMFQGCSSLKELNLSNFDTCNVININSMFIGCSSLKKINLTNFNTDNVINMSFMFANCLSLEELNLFNFNIDKVNYMTSMFLNCSSLKKLNFPRLYTNNKADMSYILQGCSDELKNKISCQKNNLINKNFFE